MTGAAADQLLFELDGTAYGLDASLVRTTHWLPELSPAPEAPAAIVGRFNLRGEIVPVIDLAICLGHMPHRLAIGDQVVVLDLEGGPMAVVVSQLLDLIHPRPEELLPLPREESADGLVTGILQTGNVLVTLIDVRRLPMAVGERTTTRETPGQAASPEEEVLYQARAESLRHLPADGEQVGRSLAVVDLGGQYFGLDLRQVREFCKVPQLRPLPCCPPHVAGVFNLRGQLVTLLEIASALGLPPPDAPRPKAVIGILDGMPVGVGVDEVIDVFNPGEADLLPVPTAAGSRPGVEIRGVTLFADRRISIIDLPVLLNQDRWEVNETVP
ncbi:MAG: chemotaxis protein CheW [Actinomycetota bacterium]